MGSLYQSLTGQEQRFGNIVETSPSNFQLKPVWCDAGKYDRSVVVGEKPQPKPTLPEIPTFATETRAPPIIGEVEKRAEQPHWVDKFLAMVTPAKSSANRQNFDTRTCPPQKLPLGLYTHDKSSLFK